MSNEICTARNICFSLHFSPLLPSSPPPPSPRMWVLQGLEVSGSEAVVAAFSQLCAELEVAREEKKHALGALQAKREKIDAFTVVAVS